MYLQYCNRGCVVLMSLPELFGLIKLSYRQAEGRRINTVVLCLKYIASLFLAAALLLFSTGSPGFSQRAALTAAAAAAGLFAVCMRGILIREMYLTSEGFLRHGCRNPIPCPGIPATLSFELACLAAAWSVNFVLMSPAYICLRFGIRYYSLSAHRQGFMLLLAAASLLAAGGALFAAVIRSRLSCAEYLWLCGRCKGALSALDCSWYLSEGSCGDLLRLKWLSLLFAPALSHLCAMNFSQKLLRRNGMPSRNALRIELIRDIRGEQFLELT